SRRRHTMSKRDWSSDVCSSDLDTLFRDPQASGKYSKIQAVVSFQSITEEVTDKADHLIIISCLERLIKRNIIFIDQQDDFLAVMLFEELGKSLQACRRHAFRHGIEPALCRPYLCQLCIGFFFIIR